MTLHAPAEAVRRVRARRLGRRSSRSTSATCEYRTGDDDLDWLALRIAMFGVDFDVHEPPELQEHLLTLSGRLRRAADR